MGIETRIVAADEADLRLDRWFKRRYPALGHGALEKLLRTGQIRVDGGRAKANARLEAGQTVRVPPLGAGGEAPKPQSPPDVDAADAEALRASVLYRDDALIVIAKPPGLAVQGGSGTTRHLDGMAEVLRFEAKERPRLVHRLDKDTSGVLVLARSAKAAAALSRSFQGRLVRKLYWAVVAGAPRPAAGAIDQRLLKAGPKGAEKVRADEGGQKAITLFRTLDHAAKRAALLALMPITGRNHQIRAHCVALGTPILGDGKYGGAAAFVTGEAARILSRTLHLHARTLSLPHPMHGAEIRLTAPAPKPFQDSLSFLGLTPGADDDDLDVFDDA